MGRESFSHSNKEKQRPQVQTGSEASASFSTTKRMVENRGEKPGKPGASHHHAAVLDCLAPKKFSEAQAYKFPRSSPEYLSP